MRVAQKFTRKNVGVDEAKCMEPLPGQVAGQGIPLGEKYLEILIYRCEADWAYAMDMKKAISNQESGAGG